MTFTQNQNKMLYNKVFFDTNSMVLLMFSRIHRTNPKFNNTNQVVKYDTKDNAVNYFEIFKVGSFSFLKLKLWTVR